MEKDKRKIIFHYHLFKNAGTSIDAALKEAFGEKNWVTKEFPNNPTKNRTEVKEWILDNPEAVCFSSHTAFLPPPQIDGVDVFPIIFLRNPVDRIISAYNFERKQQAETFGAVLAKHTDLEGYVKVRLALPNDRQCRNFQTHRLSMMYPESEGDELTRAKKALKELPFVGRVEKFEESIGELNRKLEKFFGLKVNLRVKAKNKSDKSEVSALSKKTKKIIEANNFDDLELIFK